MSPSNRVGRQRHAYIKESTNVRTKDLHGEIEGSASRPGESIIFFFKAQENKLWVLFHDPVILSSFDRPFICLLYCILLKSNRKREKSKGITTGKQKGEMPMAAVKSSRVYLNFILKILHWQLHQIELWIQFKLSKSKALSLSLSIYIYIYIYI